MSHSRRIPIWLWRWMHRLNSRISGSYQRGARLGHLVLLLTTTGRKTGLPRATPLQYEIVDGAIVVASARGQEADWFRNVVANPRVRVRITDRQFEAVAEPITDPSRVADFLELRLRRHPIMIRLMLWAEGLPLRFNRAELEAFAADKAIVAIRSSVQGKPSCMNESTFRQEVTVSTKRTAVILVFAFIGWALCGAIMGIGRQVTSLETTLIVHAVGAPVIFAILAWIYFKRFRYTTPLQTAVIFVAFVVLMDVFVVALLMERSFAMFASLVGTWLPFMLIFAATYLTGQYLIKPAALR